MKWLLGCIIGSCLFLVIQPVWSKQAIQSEGIAIDFDWSKIGTNQARFSFYIRDTVNAAPVLGAYPAAWVHPRTAGGKPAQECQQQAETFVGGSLFSRAEIDLNQYYVLTMNGDASLSLVDPLFGFGGSKLLNRIVLPSPAYDWVLTKQGRYLWMSFPEAQSIGRLDTNDWTLETIKLKEAPQELSLQADEHFLWVALNTSVVAIIADDRLKLKATIALPSKPREMELSPDSHFLYLTLPAQNSLALIDTAQLKLQKIQKTGKNPSSLAYSKLAQLLYVANQTDGSIEVFSAQDLKPVAKMQSEPGVGQLRFDPSGRWGFLVNPVTDRLSIIDAANNQIVQTGLVESEPVSIDFSNSLAYIQHRNSATLLMISLDDKEIGRPGAPIPVIDAPGGDYPPGLGASTVAPGIVKAPGASAVLIANPKDQNVYFYKEGMAAPMGQFGNYGQEPRAVIALDRSLRDAQGQGIYETIAALPTGQQQYDVVFFMDSPRQIHCFTMDLTDKSSSQADINNIPQFQALSADSGYKVQQLMDLHFKNSAKINFSDINVIISVSSGLWQQRQRLKLTSKGELKVVFTPPIKGLYQLQYQVKNGKGFSELGEKWYEVQ
ncbi:MAG: beta-propeller fold lactonase family protein [Alcanivoracaceae bacterium]|nr:beta-propeller fold lactonase family protein [Alcanivoracaceae bacterium]